MKKNSKKGAGCYLYTRVSTSMQVDGYSLEAQQNKMEKYAEYEEMPILGIYSDEGKSGKSIEGRPMFQQMMRDIETGKDNVKFVLVFKLSRFGRNAADVLNSLQFMQDFGVNLICVEDAIDSSKDSGKLMISVLSAVAEVERDNILVQTMEGRKQKARNGEWNGGMAPFGYKLLNGKLIIDEEEAKIVKFIFNKYINESCGIAGIVKYLNRNGVTKKPKGNRGMEQFSSLFVKNILDNPVYIGKVAYGRRSMQKVEGTRNSYRQVKQDDYILVDGVHEAIISEDVWALTRKKRKETGVTNERKRMHLLSGILRCPVCGNKMVGNIAYKKTKDGTQKKYFYYTCKHRKEIDGHKCTYKKQWKEDMVNDAVVSVLRQLTANEKFADIIKQKIGNRVDTSEIDAEIANCERQLKQISTSKKNLEYQIDRLAIDDRHYKKKLVDMQERLDKLYDEIAEIEEMEESLKIRKENIERNKISADNIYKYLLNFEKLYDKFNDEEKRTFIKNFVSEIQIYEEKQEFGQFIKSIHFKFPIYYNGRESDTMSLDKETQVESRQYPLPWQEGGWDGPY